MNTVKTYQELLAENEQLRWQLTDATDAIQAIRTGQIDALVVANQEGHEIYTLKTADHTYRIFIETMNEGALTLNADRLIVYSNSTVAAMVNRPLSAIVGLPLDQFVTPACLPLYRTLFEDDRTTNQKVEIAILTGTGDELPCLLSLTKLGLNEGTAYSLILTDLTAQKEAQRLLVANNQRLAETNTALEVSNMALSQSNDNLQQFAYVASHDLQEPLRKIQQFGSLLKLRYANSLDAEGRDLIGRMEQAALRMSGLIRDVLAYSRLTVPVNAYVEQPLNGIVSDVLSTLDVVIQEKAATIEVGDLGYVPGDATQLTQVFQNLLTNALKFTNQSVPAVIRISRRAVSRAELPRLYQPLSAHRYFCAIQVADNGIGFATHQSDRIFGTFQRLHGKKEYPGTGIGLAIVKKAVENHHGYVTAAGEPGQGATFTVFLPVLQ